LQDKIRDEAAGSLDNPEPHQRQGIPDLSDAMLDLLDDVMRDMFTDEEYEHIRSTYGKPDASNCNGFSNAMGLGGTPPAGDIPVKDRDRNRSSFPEAGDGFHSPNRPDGTAADGTRPGDIGVVPGSHSFISLGSYGNLGHGGRGSRIFIIERNGMAGRRIERRDGSGGLGISVIDPALGYPNRYQGTNDIIWLARIPDDLR